MTLPARALPALDRGLEPVAALARQRRLGGGDGPPGAHRPDRPGAPPGALHADGRRPDRQGRPSRSHLPRRGRGGRTFGSKRSILVDILGLPFACRVDPARRHDAASARLLLLDDLAALPRLRAIVADRAYRGLGKLAARRGLALDIKAPPAGVTASCPSGRWSRSSTPSPSLGAGGACRAPRAPTHRPRPGLRWRPWAISSRVSGSSPPDRPAPPPSRSRSRGAAKAARFELAHARGARLVPQPKHGRAMACSCAPAAHLRVSRRVCSAREFSYKP